MDSRWLPVFTSIPAYFLMRKCRLLYNTRSFVVAVAVLFSTYFAISAGFAVIDLTGTNRERKVQHDTCISAKEYCTILVRVLLLVLIVVVPVMYLLWVYVMPARRARRLRHTIIDTDSCGLVVFIIVFVACMCISEICSWSVHKLLHLPFLFEHVHRHHHKHVAPVALASIDAHPLEVVVWDILPLVLGPVLIGTGAGFTAFFLWFGIVQTLAAHCGYAMFYFDGSFHDLHHERMKCNYGANLFMDRIAGTYLDRVPGAVYPRWDQQVKSLRGSRNVWCHGTRPNNENYSTHN